MEHPENRTLEASVSGVLAGLRAMQGDFDRARSLQARSRELQEELGQRFRIVNVGAMLAAEIEELAGRPDEAVSMLRWAYDTLVEMGAASVTATIAAFLADALCLVGRYDEAEEVSRVSEDAPESDVVTQVLWRTARARAIVHARSEAAETLAREALATAQATDYPDLEARALLSVAEVVGAGRGGVLPARRSQASLRGEGQRRGGYASVGCAVSTVIGLTPTPTR